MKISAISGVTCQVEDLQRTAEFYEGIGFRPGSQEGGRLTMYVNWFWVTFVAQEPGQETPDKGAGTSLHMKVDSVDEFHRDLVARGLRPSGPPEKGPARTREFALRDPDGHRLVFFEKK